MRVKTVHGRHLLVGGFIKAEHIRPGQVWATLTIDWSVVVDSIDDEWVTYSWMDGNKKQTHEMYLSSFQCRYYLCLPTREIPEYLLK